MAIYDEVIIFGVGGVGSWLSNYLIRNKVVNTLSIVDFDKIEEKNLFRQDYHSADLGIDKVDAIKVNSCGFQIEGRDNEVNVVTYNRKIEDEIDFEGLNKNAIAIISTDNMTSKRLIANNFKDFLIVACDKDFVEIKNFLDESDLKSWDMGGGYSNAQDITSNIYCANLLFYLLNNGICRFHRQMKFVKKIETEFHNDWKQIEVDTPVKNEKGGEPNDDEEDIQRQFEVDESTFEDVAREIS